MEKLPNELFIGKIPPSSTKAEIEAHFSKFGKIEKMTMPHILSQQKHKGFGFVAFKKAVSMEKALAGIHKVRFPSLFYPISNLITFILFQIL